MILRFRTAVEKSIEEIYFLAGLAESKFLEKFAQDVVF